MVNSNIFNGSSLHFKVKFCTDPMFNHQPRATIQKKNYQKLILMESCNDFDILTSFTKSLTLSIQIYARSLISADLIIVRHPQLTRHRRVGRRTVSWPTGHHRRVLDLLQHPVRVVLVWPRNVVSGRVLRRRWRHAFIAVAERTLYHPLERRVRRSRYRIVLVGQLGVDRTVGVAELLLTRSWMDKTAIKNVKCVKI